MIKSKFNTDGISIKIGIIFSRFGISPNIWTLISIIPAVLGFGALYTHHLIYGLILFLISGIIDAIDGSVARVTGRVTSFGAFLDGIVDRYVEILLYLGLLFYGISGLWISLLIFGAIMPSFVRAYADHRGVVTEPEDHRRMGGILERGERLTLIYIGMLLGHFDFSWLLYIIKLAAILGNITALQRIWFVFNYKK